MVWAVKGGFLEEKAVRRDLQMSRSLFCRSQSMSGSSGNLAFRDNQMIFAKT